MPTANDVPSSMTTMAKRRGVAVTNRRANNQRRVRYCSARGNQPNQQPLTDQAIAVTVNANDRVATMTPYCAVA